MGWKLSIVKVAVFLKSNYRFSAISVISTSLITYFKSQQTGSKIHEKERRTYSTRSSFERVRHSGPTKVLLFVGPECTFTEAWRQFVELTHTSGEMHERKVTERTDTSH